MSGSRNALVRIRCGLAVATVSLFGLAVPANSLANGMSNVALGKQVLADSSYPGYPPGNLVDGFKDWSHAWNAGYYATPATPHWVIIDLATPTPLSDVTVYGVDTATWDYYYVDFDLDGSNNGVDWSGLGTGRLVDPFGVDQNSGLNVETFHVGFQSFRYIRVLSRTGTSWTAVAEVEVFAPGYAVPAFPGNAAFVCLFFVLVMTGSSLLRRDRFRVS